MTARVGYAGCLSDGRPRLKIAVEVADGDDPLRLLSGGRRAEDAEQGGKRCKRDADDPPQAGDWSPLHHARTVAPARRSGNAVNDADLKAPG